MGKNYTLRFFFQNFLMVVKCFVLYAFVFYSKFRRLSCCEYSLIAICRWCNKFNSPSANILKSMIDVWSFIYEFLHMVAVKKLQILFKHSVIHSNKTELCFKPTTQVWCRYQLGKNKAIRLLCGSDVHIKESQLNTNNTENMNDRKNLIHHKTSLYISYFVHQKESGIKAVETCSLKHRISKQ